jgi:hypothetical protein
VVRLALLLVVVLSASWRGPAQGVPFCDIWHVRRSSRSCNFARGKQAKNRLEQFWSHFLSKTRIWARTCNFGKNHCQLAEVASPRLNIR